MPVLDRVELYHVALPLPAPFAPSWIPGTIRTAHTICLARFVTDDGIDGWSAFPAAGRERAGMGDLLASLFLGQDPEDIDLMAERLHIMAVGGNVNWWLEPAFWDIKAKRAGVPLFRLLGGTHDRLTLYASGGELKSVEARCEEAEKRVAEGFGTMKVRVHDFDEAVDIAHVTGVARHMEGRMKIAVDCNQAFRLTANGPAPLWSLDRAKRFADAAADAGLAWVEEPLFGDWHEEMAELTAHARVPIAGGELHIAGFRELARMARMGCYSIFQPDAMWAGGVAQCLKVADVCRTLGLRFTPHCWSTGFGFIVNAHVFAASGFAGEELYEYPIAEPGWLPEARDAIFTTPMVHENGTFAMPNGPGLGVTVDEAALARYGRRFFAASRREVSWTPSVLG